MKNAQEFSGLPLSKNLKVVPTNDGKYEVYFDFLPIPVTMNKAYLNVVVNELKPNDFNQTMTL
ncbi:MAG: hypothetical protein P1U56_04875 [Saprospiraceae bacterium]|nr:hypothetical protein [Saprospiraceae bacterium]